MYMTMVGAEALTTRQVKARERIARRCGGEFVYAKLPEGPRSWFECQNFGGGFNDDFSWRVEVELRALEEEERK